ncbi:MAG: VOC family protein [Actinomycetes bacterium]
MELEGMHHITMITGDARKNVEFYSDVLGLRLVKKTVNFDAPQAYHLYFGDEKGSPGSILTWFEFAGAAPGNPGAGMIHTIQLGVPSEASLDFWAQRLADNGHTTEAVDGVLRFADFEGLQYELAVADPENPRLQAEHPEVPAEHAITGVQGVRAFATHELDADRDLLTSALGFTEVAAGEYVVEGGGVRFRYGYDPHPGYGGREGTGTVHHIAWHSRDEDHEVWRERAGAAGAQVTQVIDRDYFKAIYFRQPQGILFEIATTSPGFAVDEAPGHLGEELRLPAQHEHRRAQLEQILKPLGDPRANSAQPPTS